MESPDILEDTLAGNDIIGIADQKRQQPERSALHHYALVFTNSLPLMEVETEISKGKVIICQRCDFHAIPSLAKRDRPNNTSNNQVRPLQKYHFAIHFTNRMPSISTQIELSAQSASIT